VASKQIRAHEFHYSSLENLPVDSQFAYHVERGYGISNKRDGFVLRNMLASYSHLRTVGSCYWAPRFVAFIRRCKDSIKTENAKNKENLL
jgi:cobyrinic acid a,c-diamide synthase